MPRTAAATDGASSPGPPTDGRRARGERRRAELIAATLRVVEREGAAGVTHRSVAREAGAPTSLVTYYFTTLDELLVAALTDVSRYYETAVRAVLDDDDPLAGLARLLAESGTETGRGRALAERELSTLAARRPALRGFARGWRAMIAEVARTSTDDPTAGAALIAVADGLCASVLLADDPPDADRLLPVLRHAIGADTATRA